MDEKPLYEMTLSELDDDLQKTLHALTNALFDARNAKERLAQIERERQGRRDYYERIGGSKP